MKILVSCIPFDRGRSGISVYIRQTVAALARAGHELVLVLEPDAAEDPAFAGFRRIVAPRWTKRPALNMLWHIYLLPYRIRFRDFDMALLLAANRRAFSRYPIFTAAVVHDLSQYHVPTKYDRFRMFYIKHLLPHFVRKAQAAVAISRSTADDLKRFWKIPESRLHVIYNGLSILPESRERDAAPWLAEHGVTRPYILYISRLEHPGKNHVNLIKAYDMLPAELAERFDLVLPGASWSGSEAVFAAAGGEFNLNSPKQLGEVLFVRLGLPSGKKNSNGYSTNAEILEKLAPAYPVVSDILRYRKLTKLYGTYVAGLLKAADRNGFVHTVFRQTGTATGRLSSAEPNLQNIPIKTEEGRELRRFFLPKEGHILIDADYSQIELRILASISGDENMIAAFNAGADIHRSTAAAVFRVAPEEVTPLMRKRAKAVNFGIVYGIGDYSLSQDLGITVKQANDYIRDYFRAYPGVEAYLSDSVAQASGRGYTETLFGRRRYIPELSAKNGNLRKYGERVAMNSPIQGTAADIIKIAMINTSRRLREESLDARLILQIHDELIVDSAAECADRASAILRECMEGAASMPVKLTVDLETGDSLLI